MNRTDKVLSAIASIMKEIANPEVSQAAWEYFHTMSIIKHQKYWHMIVAVLQLTQSNKKAEVIQS